MFLSIFFNLLFSFFLFLISDYVYGSLHKYTKTHVWQNKSLKYEEQFLQI